MSEEKWDRLLQIRTSGRDDSHADQYRYPYEPTPYCVLKHASGLWMRQRTCGVLFVLADKVQVDRD